MAIAAMKILVEVVVPNLDGEEDMCSLIDDMLEYIGCSGDIIKQEMMPYLEEEFDAEAIACAGEEAF